VAFDLANHRRRKDVNNIIIYLNKSNKFMNNKIFQTNHYESPRVEMIVVEVEQGIAASITTENPGCNPEQDW
jgi:hypothetical protein